MNNTDESQAEVDYNLAQASANNCCGVNAPELRNLSSDSVLEMRRQFLLNVAYNGKRSHQDIINVLEYMTPYTDINSD